MDFDHGRSAAQRLWEEGLSAGPIADPLNPEFARGALIELEKLQKSTPGILKEVLEGAQISAEQLNVDAFHGIKEVIQNADDLGAREVRVAIRKRGGRSTLLIAHNGRRVSVDHVIAMTLAFVSTKRDDPRATGRFGIGLKTLGRLGTRLTVHCAPYDFVIENNNVSRASATRKINSFFDPQSSDTLLELSLGTGFNERVFLEWFSELGAASLLFLDSVHSLQMFDLRRGRNIVRHKITARSQHRISLPTLSETARCTVLRDPKSRLSWIRYDIDRKVPSGLKRQHKAMGPTTPMGIAIPTIEGQSGRLYAGLPLGIHTQLPFSLNAQFDPDTARRGIQHGKLNEWILRRLGELVSAVALQLVETEPTTAWTTIPLSIEGVVDGDKWLSGKIADLVDATQTRVRQRLTLMIDGGPRRLREIAYEAESINHLISQAELEGLKPSLGLKLIPDHYRDPAGRWRRVLSELGRATEIVTAEAIKLFDWQEEDLSHRDVNWFIKLARAALDDDLGQKIWLQKSIVTSTAKRIVPPMPHHEGEILTKSEQQDSLPFRLGLAHAIHPAYLSASSDAVVIRKWLEDNSMLHEALDAESTLRALAVREGKQEPFALGDQDLKDLRDMLEDIPKILADELGPRIGRVVAINVYRWERGKRVHLIARPADAYMPASIEDRKDGWAKAAAKTSDISWINPHYRKVLQREANRRKSGAGGQSLAAQGLLRLLGVENSPRLAEPERFDTRYEDRASPIDWQRLSDTQRAQLGNLPRNATHLKHDHSSPDLMAVLRDLRRERSGRQRRERVRTLISTLEREWTRLYARHLKATAVFSDYTWQHAGTITATWIAWAMDERWLRSEANKLIAPRSVVVRTRGTEAIYGNDRERFARDLTETDAISPVIRALGIETDPQVSELIDQLSDMRARRDTPSEHDLNLRYAAISANCKHRHPIPEMRVGDITVRQLRARFGTKRSKEGLIFSKGHWLAPSRVYLGAPIFGERRAFVSERSAAALWHTLKIQPPTIDDCLYVLEEIATEERSEIDDQVLVNTYQYIEQRMKDASYKELARLKNLPVWTGTDWLKTRPVYLPLIRDIVEELSRSLPIWKLPLVASVVPNLIEAADVTILNAGSFSPVVRTGSFFAGTALNEQFRSAVELLEDWLARHDPVLARSLSVPWDVLANPQIACDQNLQIELELDKASTTTVNTRAHISNEPLTFYFVDSEVIGEDDAGGQIIASLFSEGDQDKLALAWSRCWARAASGSTGSVKLVEDEANTSSLESLFEQASTRKTYQPPIRKTAGSPDHRKNEKQAPPEPEVRRLKRFEQFSDKTVDLLDSAEKNRSPASGRRGLRGQTPVGQSIRNNRNPASKSAPLDYSEKEKEDLALHLLQLAINGEASELQDYRHLRGIGADALDKLERYFEIKAYYGPMPDEVSLTANEAERAFITKNKFFLAVVSGLEHGYETVVKIVPNPFQNLKPKSSTSVTLTGITSCKSAIEVRFADRGDTDESNEPTADELTAATTEI